MKTIRVGNDAALLTMKSYSVWPKRGNGPADFSLVVDGKVLLTDDVRKTGGGKFPKYTYLRVDGQIFYVAADLPVGAKITVVKEDAVVKEEVKEEVKEVKVVKVAKAAKAVKLS